MSKIFTAIGLMSGTSMDGIDVAIIRTDGERHVERLPYTHFHSYNAGQRESLALAMRQAAKLYMSRDKRDTRPPLRGEQATIRAGFAQVEQMLSEQHALAVEEFLTLHSIPREDIDLVAMHGQTVLHIPRPGNFTLQLGDAQTLSDRIGLQVIADFRSNDVASGGEGAPLVPVYHKALAAVGAVDLPAAVVNVGGVANVTYVGADGELIAFDTGPGNALLDDWMAMKTGVAMDCDGACAAGGLVAEWALSALLDNVFFSLEPPKSLDRNAFSLELIKDLPVERGAATLTSFTALAVARADFFFPVPPKIWIICGGGARNPTLMREFRRRLDGAVTTADEIGWSSDFMEAEAFAYLGVRSSLGLPISFPTTTGVSVPLDGGRHFTPTVR